jgi:hypothetical protein
LPTWIIRDLSASTDIFISPLGKIPGWRMLSYRIQLILSMTGMRGYLKNAIKPTQLRESLMKREI